MVYSYVSHVKRSMYDEIRHCKSSASDIWGEVTHLKNLPSGNRTALDAVILAHQEQEVPQDDLEDLESPEQMVCQETQAEVAVDVDQKLHHHANHAQLDPLDLLDHQDQLEVLELTDHLETLDPVSMLDHPDLRDHLAPTEILANLEDLDSLDHPPSLHHLLLDHLDLLDQLEHLERQDLMDNLDTVEELAHLVPRDLPDPTANPVPMETQDLPVHLEMAADRESPVSAPSTAPSMEASSSRMELAVVKLDVIRQSTRSNKASFT
ncbi:hypothetical protein OSTOST_06721, partial [Ostertagia ostertagi]